MLGTSDAWSMSHLSHPPSKPAYYIEDCRISSAYPSGYLGYIISKSCRGISKFSFVFGF